MALIAVPVHPATSLPFDSGWRFLKGSPAAAEQPQFDDAAWRAVNVAHDWAIEGPFDEKNPAGGAGAVIRATASKGRIMVGASSAGLAVRLPSKR